MNPANDATATIGPATERRIQMAFADTCLLTCQATARLLGMDEKSLRALTEDGVIRAVRRGAGRNRAYTEGDIRSYLTESAAPIRQERPKVNAGTGQLRVVPFSQRKKTRAR
jgi:hypothetical protein